MSLDHARLAAIVALRAYAMHSPFEAGRWRIEQLANRVARSIRGSHAHRVRSRDGRQFLVDPREPQYQMGLIGSGDFEPFASESVRQHLAEGALAVDIGANFGWFTTLFSRAVGPHGTVHAFEPLPSTFAALQSNCALNDCANVTLNCAALGDRPARAEIHYFHGEPHGNASLYPDATRQSQTVHCEMMTLDAYLEGRGATRCDFIKCDAEGAELAVLSGATGTIRVHRPTILIELNAQTSALAGYAPIDLLLKLRSLAEYRFYRLDERYGRSEIDAEDEHAFNDYVNVLCVA